MDCSKPARLLCPWDSPGKNTGVGCHALLQGIFLTQRSNLSLLCLLHWQVGSLPLAPPGKPMFISTTAKQEWKREVRCITWPDSSESVRLWNVGFPPDIFWAITIFSLGSCPRKSHPFQWFLFHLYSRPDPFCGKLSLKIQVHLQISFFIKIFI